MTETEYHRHSGGDVIQGPAERCIDPGAGAEDVAVLSAAEQERSLRQHRLDWASWLESWDGAVGPEPPTIVAVIEWLRADSLPFGCATADAKAAPEQEIAS